MVDPLAKFRHNPKNPIKRISEMLKVRSRGLAVLAVLFLVPMILGIDFEYLLIHGRVSRPNEFPEVVQIYNATSSCTATIVGPRVILTAAHCAQTNTNVTFTHEGVSYTAIITRSDRYDSLDHDMALGLVDEFISTKYGIVYGSPGLGERIYLSGFGCTEFQGPSDVRLRVGDSVVVSFDGYDFVAEREDGAVLCFGDSGGPSFSYMFDPYSEDHFVLGVNSKGNIKDRSLITRMDHQDSMAFLNSWSEKNGVEICGINRQCRGNTTDPNECFKEKVRKELMTLASECPYKSDIKFLQH